MSLPHGFWKTLCNKGTIRIQAQPLTNAVTNAYTCTLFQSALKWQLNFAIMTQDFKAQGHILENSNYVVLVVNYIVTETIMFLIKMGPITAKPQSDLD